MAPALKAFETVGQSLGFLNMETRAFHEEVKAKRLNALGLTAGDVDAALADRDAARADKDWARADAIRKDLETKGVQVMDTPEGVQWRLRLHTPE